LCRAASIVGGTLALLLVLSVTARFTGWPEPESPPRQGEALDSVAFARGELRHSADAEARMIREPLNTWTNLAFTVAGAALVARSIYPSSRLVGWTLVAVSVGSFLYHASASRTLRHFDVGAMYALFFCIAVAATPAVRLVSHAAIDRRARVLAVVAVAIAIVVTFARNVVIFGIKPLALSVATACTATVFAAALLSTARQQPRASVFWRASASLGLFAVAVVCQTGDRPGAWLCAPNALIQAHALWHVLAAAAVFVGMDVIDAPDPRPSTHDANGMPPSVANASRTLGRTGSSTGS
jgi:hypothetical protein